MAPPVLRNTLAAALGPGRADGRLGTGIGGQFAHLAFPFTLTEQAPVRCARGARRWSSRCPASGLRQPTRRSPGRRRSPASGGRCWPRSPRWTAAPPAPAPSAYLLLDGKVVPGLGDLAVRARAARAGAADDDRRAGAGPPARPPDRALAPAGAGGRRAVRARPRGGAGARGWRASSPRPRPGRSVRGRCRSPGRGSRCSRPPPWFSSPRRPGSRWPPRPGCRPPRPGPRPREPTRARGCASAPETASRSPW